METEFETQVLDVDVDNIKKRLKDLSATGGKRVFSRRWVFDLEKDKDGMCGKWIRVREMDGKTKITMKIKSGSGITDTKEIEVSSDDFETTAKLFKNMDCFIDIVYQENYRTSFDLDGVEINIDEWPKVPAFLDIEASNEKDVHNALDKLGLIGKDAGHIGHVEIYKKYGFDLHSFKELKFKE